MKELLKIIAWPRTKIKEKVKKQQMKMMSWKKMSWKLLRKKIKMNMIYNYHLLKSLVLSSKPIETLQATL